MYDAAIIIRYVTMSSAARVWSAPTHMHAMVSGLQSYPPDQRCICTQEFGGMAQYARWSAERRGADPAAAKAEDFYADAWAQSVFHNYMATLTSRVNTLTGTAYR